MQSAQQMPPDGAAPAKQAAYPWLKVYPKEVDWYAKFDPEPLPAFMDRAAARFAARPATEFFGKILSYAELAREADRAARGLQQLGVGKGTAVGLLLPQLPGLHCLLLCDP